MVMTGELGFFLINITYVYIYQQILMSNYYSRVYIGVKINIYIKYVI